MDVYPPKPPKKELNRMGYVIIGALCSILALLSLSTGCLSAYGTYKASAVVVLGIACIIYGMRRK